MKKEKKVWALTLLAFWWLSPNQTQAQQDSVRQLNEVVITATRSEQPIIEVPRSVTVIHREEIENRAHNSVGELLANHPGIFIVGTNQVPGTNQSLFMRGANSNQVVILIDGIRITDPSSPSSSIDLSELSLTDVERIEIIRGAHSTLFGGSAIGGAINIITRKSSAPGFHGAVNVQGGTLGNSSVATSSNLGASYAFQNGFYFNGSVFTQHVRGFDATIDTIRDPGKYKTNDHDNFRKTDAYLKAGYAGEKWDASLSFKNVDQRTEIDNGAFNDDDNAYIKFQRRLIGYSARYKATDKLSVSFLGSWSDSERLNRNDSSINDFQGNYDKTFSTGKYKGSLLTNEAILQHRFNNFSLSLGAGQFREGMEFNTYFFSNAFGPFESKVNYDTVDLTTRTEYAFLQLTYEKGHFGFSGGTRFSNHSRFGNVWTFELSPSYRIEDFIFYGSVSSGFNAPSLYQLYDPSQGLNAYTTRGNAALKPEESLSFETGIKKEFISGSYLTLSAFRSNTRNAIEYVNLWNQETPLNELSYLDYLGDTYLNLTSQVIHGVEASGHLQLTKFYLKGNVTWIDGQITFSPSDIDTEHTGRHHVQPYNYGSFINTEVETNKLIRKPQLTGFAEAGFKPLSALWITAAMRHAGSRFDVVYDPDLGPFGALGRTNIQRYNLLDLGATWKVSPAWIVGLKVENVLNENFLEIQGFQTRGRSGYIKLQFKW